MTRSNCNLPAPILEYIEMIEQGKVLACAEQHKLVALVRKAFETEDLCFIQEQFDEYMGYQKYFPFDLFPWETFCFALHNCTYDAEGDPRWPHLLMLLGRGSGKNGFLSFEDFCLLTPTNGIPHYHIDICANSEDQARTSFDEIKEVLENPKFKAVMYANFYWIDTRIENLKTGSVLKYRTSNAKTKDGGRQGKVDFDEIHAYEDWASLNVFTTGLGKKEHPRITYATTDGDVRDGPLDQIKERSAKILNGEIPDNGLLPFICKLDKEEEVSDPDNWVKAVPSLPYKPVLRKQMILEYENYRIDPVKNSAFMTKRMNIPKGNADVQVTSWENIKRTNRPVPDLEGRSCVLGLDLARTTDCIGAFLLFRDGDEFYGIHHSWFCARSRDAGRIKAPFQEWSERGILTIVDADEIHPQMVVDWIHDMRLDYSIEAVALDSYRYDIFSRALDQIGFSKEYGNVKMVRPSDIMHVQTKIDSVFARGAVIWGDDPMMRWYTNNTKLVKAPNNNFKYDKIEPKARKTDGFMAYVHAMTVEDRIPEAANTEFLEPIIF